MSTKEITITTIVSEQCTFEHYQLLQFDKGYGGLSKSIGRFTDPAIAQFVASEFPEDSVEIVHYIPKAK